MVMMERVREIMSRINKTIFCPAVKSLPKVFFTLGLLVLGLSSCKKGATVYHAYLPVPSSHGWNVDDTLTFTLPPNLLQAHYQLQVELRNSDDYPYKDIWLSVSNNFRDSLKFDTDTLHLYLSDATGRWINSTTAGSFFQSAFPLNKPFTLQMPSHSTQVRITHIMQQNPLPGITDVGIKLSLTRSVDTKKNE